jgi:hypothetical protein
MSPSVVGIFGSFNNPSGIIITAPFGGNAALVHDGNNSTYLTTNTSTGSAFVVMLADHLVSRSFTQLGFINISFSGGTTSTFVIETSPDNSTWTQYGAAGTVTPTNSNFANNVTVTCRYVRLRASGFGVNGACSVGEYIFT